MDPALDTAATQQIADDTLDYRIPIIADDKFELPFPDETAEPFRSAFRTLPFVPAVAHDTYALRVAQALVKLLPKLSVVPANLTPDHHEDFRWAKTRCLFAGFGFPLHAEIARAIRAIYPSSPIDPTEDLIAWEAALHSAHQACGWPVGIASIPWAALYAVAPALKPGDHVPAPWENAVAALHVLKHVALSPITGVCAVYRSHALSVIAPADTSRLTSERVLAELMPAIGCFSSGPAKKAVNILAMAVRRVLSWLNKSDVLSRTPLGALPTSVLWGEWSRYAPAPADPSATGFIQHGMTLAGVRVAGSGQVRDAEALGLGADDILGYDWRIDPVDAPALAAEAEWRTVQVDAYTARSPTAILQEAFPHLALVRKYEAAHRAAIDAVIVGQVLRCACPRLIREFPLLLVMPSDPSPEAATNQGKSTCSEAILRSLASAPQVRVSKDASNYDIRSAIEFIERCGTVGLDEWDISLLPRHVFNRENIQTLCTGKPINAGRAGENDARAVALRAPLVANAKAMELPPDIVNRSLFLWLDVPTAAQRANAATFERATSGRLSLEMRLAALGLAEAHALAPWLNETPIPGSAENRFNTLRALAARLLSLETGATPLAALRDIDAVFQAMHARNAEHTQEASASGMLGVIQAGADLSLHLTAVFGDMTPSEAGNFLATLKAVSGGRKTGCLASELLRARMGSSGAAADLPDAVRLWCGTSNPLCRASATTITRAFLKDLKIRLPTPGMAIALPGTSGFAGYVLRRLPDQLIGEPRHDGTRATQAMWQVECQNPVNADKSSTAPAPA